MASEKLRQFSGLSFSGTGLSASQTALLAGDYVSDIIGVSGWNSVGEDKSMICVIYSSPLQYTRSGMSCFRTFIVAVI